MRILITVVLIASTPLASAGQQAITIDGLYGDWATVPATTVDPTGDGGGSGVDFGSLWIADDDDSLFVRIEVGAEMSLDETNDLVLYLDTDSNSSTGLGVGGIGAELEWRFGQRNGTFHGGGGGLVFHDDLGFQGAPTVTATEFEWIIARAATPNGSTPLFSGNTIRILIREEAPAGDRIPDTGGIISYTMGSGTLPPDIELPLSRELSTDLRVVTFNVENDSPWSGGQAPRFGRQLAAADADIFCFQEIYNHSAADTVALVDAWVALPPGDSWQGSEVQDCKIVSRFPILGSWAISGNLASLVDTSSRLGFATLVVSAHLPCCGNDSGRQSEVDEIIAFVRDQRLPGGALDISPPPAVIMTGDLNLVGLAQQLTTLITGDIADQGTFGPDASLDLDGTPMADALPRQVSRRLTYTWRNDNSSFWPGRLDFILYSDSVLDIAHRFALYTPDLSPALLATSGLQSNDSLATDHVLTCADFRVPSSGPKPFRRGDCNDDGSVNLADAIRSLAVVFEGLGTSCPDACDADDNGSLGVGDAILTLGYIFQGTVPPDAPGVSICGDDPTTDAIDCAIFNCP